MNQQQQTQPIPSSRKVCLLCGAPRFSWEILYMEGNWVCRCCASVEHTRLSYSINRAITLRQLAFQHLEESHRLELLKYRTRETAQGTSNQDIQNRNDNSMTSQTNMAAPNQISVPSHTTTVAYVYPQINTNSAPETSIPNNMESE